MSIEERFEEAKKFYDNEEYDKAVPLLETLANEGHAEAQRFLGHCYYNGGGVTKDEAKSVEWFRKSAEQGNAEAQNILGYAYRFGNGIAKDNAKSFEWYSKAAEQGHAGAQCAVGDFYHTVEKDNAKAFEWYNKAAEQGQAGALLMLGDFYYKGIVVSKDKEKAFELYSKSAKKGHAVAQFAVGNLYYNGAGVAKDENKAIEWYRKAAKKGHEGAKKRLEEEERYAEAIKFYADDEYDKAVPLFEALANEGHAEAQYMLGIHYAGGTGVEVDDVKAAEWFRKAAEQGNADAQYNIAGFYFIGKGVSKDEVKAVEWMRKAAEQGHAEAQRILGQCYYEGGGVAKDEEKAIEWLRKAAEQGDEEAKNMLSEMNVTLKSSSSSVKSSENVNDESKKPRFEKAKKFYDDKKYDKAVPLLEALAEEGYAKAQYWLGCAYRLGNGVARDYVKSVEWYRNAAKQGDEGYKKMLAEIKEEEKKLEASTKSSEQVSNNSEEKTTEPKKERKKPTSGGMSCLLFLLWCVLAVGGAIGLGQLGWGWGILGFLLGALIGAIVFGSIYQKSDVEEAADCVKSGLKKKDANDYDGALSDFNKAIELDPYGSSQAYFNRAQINYKRYGDAKNEVKNDLKDNINSDMSRCVELDPTNWRALQEWSRMLDTFGLCDESKRLNDIAEDNCEYLRKKAMIYAKEYKFDEAIKCFTRAKELNPIGTGTGIDCKYGGDHGELPRVKMCKAYNENPNMFGTDYNKEIEFLQGTVESFWRRDLNTLYRLGYLLAEVKGDLNSVYMAKEYYKTIVDIDPLFKNARENLNILQNRLGGMAGGGAIGRLIQR